MVEPNHVADPFTAAVTPHPDPQIPQNLASFLGMDLATPTMAPPLSKLPDDILRKVFPLIPTDEDPTCLLRVCLTDKNFHRILADPEFHRFLREQELPPKPWVLGFLNNAKGDSRFASRFVVNNPASVRPAARHLPWRRVLDSRHSHVLFLAPSPSLGAELRYDLVVWNPLTNEYRSLPPPSPPLTEASANNINAAVLCSAAVGACDHRNCSRFSVALVCLLPDVMSVSDYSSETGDWSGPVSAQRPVAYMCMTQHPSTLAGDTLYFRCTLRYVLAYQLGMQHLSFIQGPPGLDSQSQYWDVSLMPMPMEDGGGLGCLYLEDDKEGLRLRKWSRVVADGVAQWTKGTAIELENLLPDGALKSSRSMSPKPLLLGYAEAADVIFVGTWSRDRPDAVYMVQLNSATKARKVFVEFNTVVPYTSFCIPVPAPM